MNTYINDKKLADYPFYDMEEGAPPPGCIKYLGVCLRGTTASPVYASAITVGMDGVLVSLCRDPDKEILGTVYATAADGAINMELSGGTVSGTASMLLDKTMLSNAYGTYTGKFYLDPSCVTYMDDAVAGSLHTVNINGTTYAAAQGLNFTCMGGIIELVDTDSDSEVMIRGTTAVNSYDLVVTSPYTTQLVESINEITLTGYTDYPDYPGFILQAVNPEDKANAIQIHVVSGSTESPANLVLELIGNTAFPNCYEGKGDEA